MISRDPDKVPDIPDEALRFALKHNLQVIHVICDEKGAKVGDEGAVSFVAVSPFAPQRGDRITLEDGKTCVVEKTLWKVVTDRDEDGKAEMIRLVPTVFALLQ